MVRCGTWLLVFAAAASGQIRLNYFEGEASIAGQTLKQNDTEAIRPRTTVSTQAGRMETCLAPGVFLRLGNQSSARIVSSGTVELTGGSAILDSVEAGAAAAPLTIWIQSAVVRTGTPGEYQFTFDPPGLRFSRGQAEVSAGGETKTIEASGNSITLGTGSANPPEADTLLSIWSANRRILLSSLLSGSSQPQQPLYGPDNNVAAGQSSGAGLLPFEIESWPWYVPLWPYRPGSQFFGSSNTIWFPNYPYNRYPAPARPFIQAVPPPITARPGIQPVPGFSGSGTGLYIPGPVIGH